MKINAICSGTWFLWAIGLAVAGCGGGATTEGTAASASTTAGAGGSGGVDFTASNGAGGGAAAECGDQSCDEDAGEDCETCPFDCGDCPTCDLAPTCTGALAVPTSSTPLSECDNVEQSIYSCGDGVSTPVEKTNCTDPELRFRIRKIDIQRGDLITKGIYCVVAAEDGMHSELLVTPYQTAKYGKSTLTYPVSQALFWGQGDLYKSFSNITITYNCFESSNSNTYDQIFSDISDAASDVAQNAGGYGWVFGTVAVAGQIIGSALGAVPDRHILNVQQTIAADALLELTNGRTWVIREKGGFVASAYDIKLEIESWGCSTATKIPK